MSDQADSGQGIPPRASFAFPFMFFALLGVVSLVLAFVVADSGGSGTSVSTEPATASLTEFAIGPASITASSGGGIHVSNDGTIEHNLAVEGTSVATAMLKPHDSAQLDLSSLAAGTYTLICQVPGHAAAGMKAELKVSAGGAAAGGSAAAATTTTISQQQIDDATEKSVKDFLANAANPLTKGKGAVPLDPKVLPDGTKEFDLTASVFDWEVAPGKTVQAWGYNDMVPGPTIKVAIGDKVRVVLKNELPESTSIHWHGLVVPFDQDGVPSVTQAPIKPGETYTYDFTAVGPAVGMYHAHQDSQKQVVSGLEGAFYVGDLPLPAGVTVSQQVTMILNDAGEIGFSINGKGFPATDPIVAKQGDWILINYMNEGLQIHPMHLHGFSGLIIATDGHPDPAPQEWDTVLVAPGQRISYLVHADMAGKWLFHCHILTHAESEHGYFGMATVLVVQ